MKANCFSAVIAGVAFLLTLNLQPAAQAAQKIPTKTATLIAHLIAEANHPDAHTKDDVYLLITIGKIAYTAELKSGKIMSQRAAEYASSGFYGAYAEVSLNLLNKDQQSTSQGASQILKLSAGKWKRLALSEGDYQCDNLKGIPKFVLQALKVGCN